MSCRNVKQLLLIALFLFDFCQVFGDKSNAKKICCPNAQGKIKCKKSSENLACCPGAIAPIYNNETKLCDGFKIILKNNENAQCGYNNVTVRGTHCPDDSNVLDDLNEKMLEVNRKKTRCCYDDKQIWSCDRIKKNIRCCQGAFYNKSNKLCYKNKVHKKSDFYRDENGTFHLRGQRQPILTDSTVKPIQSYFIRPIKKKSERPCKFVVDLIIPSNQPISQNRVSIEKFTLTVNKIKDCTLSEVKWYTLGSKALLNPSSNHLRVHQSDLTEVSDRLTSALDQYWKYLQTKKLENISSH